MNNKLICPFCGEELQRTYEPEEYWCYNYSCGKPHPFNLQGTKELWQALTQAKQDLEIARNALKDIVFCKQFDSVIAVRKCADKALEQIEQKESE